MIPNPPLTNSSSDLISSSKRQKNLYLNLVHFNSTPKVPWEKNWIKLRQADSTPWKMNLSSCFWNMYLPCAIAGFSARGKRDRTSQKPFRLEKGVFSQNKIAHAWEYINHNKVTVGLTDKKRRRDGFEGAFYSPNMFKKSKNLQGN